MKARIRLEATVECESPEVLKEASSKIQRRLQRALNNEIAKQNFWGSSYQLVIKSLNTERADEI